MTIELWEKYVLISIFNNLISSLYGLYFYNHLTLIVRIDSLSKSILFFLNRVQHRDEKIDV